MPQSIKIALIKLPKFEYANLRSFIDSATAKKPWATPYYERGCAVYGKGKAWRLTVCQDGRRELHIGDLDVVLHPSGEVEGRAFTVEFRCDTAKCWVRRREQEVEVEVKDLVFTADEPYVGDMHMDEVIEKMRRYEAVEYVVTTFDVSGDP